VPTECCEECGFDGHDWSDRAAIEAIGRLPAQWVVAVSGLEAEAVQRRPIAQMWSIAEYMDHVREVLFAMRFLVESAVGQPGVDLGDAPEPVFSPEPREIDIDAALAGVHRESTALSTRLTELSERSWSSTAIVSGDEVDVHWICRHAVHDATHHLKDADRLREASHGTGRAERENQ
jgi:hypothetical protein